jgi:putative tricarboxylic transport membrane protein
MDQGGADRSGLMAPPGVSADDKKALEAAVAKVVQSAPWKKLLQEREWVDLYMPSDQFTAFIKEEQSRISSLPKGLGLA